MFFMPNNDNACSTDNNNRAARRSNSQPSNNAFDYDRTTWFTNNFTARFTNDSTQIRWVRYQVKMNQIWLEWNVSDEEGNPIQEAAAEAPKESVPVDETIGRANFFL